MTRGKLTRTDIPLKSEYQRRRTKKFKKRNKPKAQKRYLASAPLTTDSKPFISVLQNKKISNINVMLILKKIENIFFKSNFLVF